jgi:NADP-dependent 3-hydroxy acid dehydrogenase YdfG
MADEPLASEVALVTGGSRGVGLATGCKLLEAGAAVALVARDANRVHEAAHSLASAGGRVVGIAAEVTDPAAMESAVTQAVAELGGLSILVNNAGLGRYGPVHEHAPDEWRQVIETNVLGVFYATRAALPAIRQHGRGQIVAISSGAARQGYPNMSAYCTSKAALEGFMRALTAEVASEPIRCTTIVPGSILTDFGVRTREDRIASGQKFLEPEDVADAVLYALLQPDRAWVQELLVWPR